MSRRLRISLMAVWILLLLAGAAWSAMLWRQAVLQRERKLSYFEWAPAGWAFEGNARSDVLEDCTYDAEKRRSARAALDRLRERIAREGCGSIPWHRYDANDCSKVQTPICQAIARGEYEVSAVALHKRPGAGGALWASYVVPPLGSGRFFVAYVIEGGEVTSAACAPGR